MATNAARAKTDKERHPDQWFDSPVGHPRDRIILHESAEATTGGRFIGLNGYSFWAQSGVEIDLPRPVRKMLDTLIRTETIRADDGKGGYTTHVRNIRRFTYTLIKEDVTADMPGAINENAQASAPSMGG